jgi:adenosylcobinamide-GDP ribazoletransferase
VPSAWTRRPELRAALSFLTPFPGARVPSPRALRWFPLVGAFIGITLGGLWWATAKIWPLPVAALIVVMADLGLTGMLHLDGLADAADGLLPHMSRERRLEVMREPTVGAFGVGTVVVVLLGRFAVFATLRPAPLLVAALWCVSRTGMAATIGRVPYARSEGGLASAFVGAPLPALIIGVIVAAMAALAGAWAVPAGPVAVAGAAVTFGAVVVWARWRIGGFTGDVLGAAGIVGETIGLIVASARW